MTLKLHVDDELVEFAVDEEERKEIEIFEFDTR